MLKPNNQKIRKTYFSNDYLRYFLLKNRNAYSWKNDSNSTIFYWLHTFMKSGIKKIEIIAIIIVKMFLTIENNWKIGKCVWCPKFTKWHLNVKIEESMRKWFNPLIFVLLKTKKPNWKPEKWGTFSRFRFGFGFSEFSKLGFGSVSVFLVYTNVGFGSVSVSWKTAG